MTALRTDDLVDQQIERTRRLVRSVDIATSLLQMATVLVGVLIAAALVEHWLVSGGFGTITRSILWLGLAAAAAIFTWRRLWPYVVQQINPLFAAHTLEREYPTLKNSLLNLLLLRRHRDEVPAAVYDTLQQQASRRLDGVSIEDAVDRTPLVRMAAVFAALIVLGTMYKVFSPKDPFATAGRVLMPWADIDAPSRVTIQDIQPGSTTVTRGEEVEITATIRGLAPDEEVRLRYSTADGQAADLPIAMQASESGLHFSCELPPRAATPTMFGLQQNATYRIEAGDARSRSFSIQVVEAPTITVTRVDYDYPEYTGYVDGIIDGLGDIRAIEGTRVTVHARANGPIDEAHLDFEADGRRDVAMRITEETAQAEFTLALRADRRTPRHSAYVLRMTAPDGRRNRDPVRHTIDVLPDYAPEIQLLAPQEKVRDVRLNETVAVEVEARDPDFALSAVTLHGTAGRNRVLDQPLLEQAHTGGFVGRFRFTPARHGLRAGDVVEYWAEASDNRTPEANRAVTSRQRFRIVEAEPNRPADDNHLAQRQPKDQQQQPDKQQQDQQQQGEPDQQQQGEQGQQGQGQQGAGQQGESGAGGQAQQDAGAEAGEGGAQRPELDGAADGQRTRSREQTDGQGEGESGESDQPGNRTHESPQGDQASQDGQPGQRQGESAEPGESGAGDSESPVSSQGDDDGEAFERITRHLNQQDGTQQQDRQDQTGQQRQGAQPQREDGAGQSSEDGQSSDSSDDSRQDGSQQGDPSQSGGPQDGKPGSRSTESGQQPSREQQPGEAGPRPDDAERGSEQSKPRLDGQRSDAEEGGEAQTTGPSGAGDQQGEDGRKPSQQPGDRSQEQWEQDPTRQTDDQGRDPQQPGAGSRKENSAGEKGGEDTGSGQQNKPKQIERDGTGTSGEGQSADEGTGESGERGTGRESTSGGDKQSADQPTGQPGDQPGDRGSGRRDGTGQQPGGKPGGESGDRGQGPEEGAGEAADSTQGQTPGDEKAQPDAARPSEATRPGADARGSDTQRPGETQSRNQQQRSEGGAATGAGGTEGNAAGEGHSDGAADPGGDEANLEYARKQTDLVLDRLSDMLEKRDVDQDLLERLGWSEDDLREFVRRWQARKSEAQKPSASEDARRQWRDALRSLGLKPRKLEGQTTRRQDDFRDLNEAVRRPVPPEFKERLQQYNQGVSRAREE